MEYVEGGQLLTRLQSNEQYVSQVINQMIDAIEYIHSLGVVHRDIKPENIVMSFEVITVLFRTQPNYAISVGQAILPPLP
jgi:serine/threonine protein kinase